MNRLICSLLVGTCLGCAATRDSSRPVAEVPIAQELEVTPGLRVEDVRRALAPVEARLPSCMRVARLASGPPGMVTAGAAEFRDLREGADDRVWVRFRVDASGELKVLDVRSVYLEEECVEALIRELRFDPLEVLAVDVTWWTRFASTAEEREAFRAELAKSYARVCSALTEDLPASGGEIPADYHERSMQRVLALVPQLHPRTKMFAEGIANVWSHERWEIFQLGSREFLLTPDCPKLEQAEFRRESVIEGSEE